jgi:chromosome segregation ATPase
MLTINFDKFNKAGLKQILDKFNKAGLKVADVEADNKPKRESGFQVKSALIIFESGQKLLVKAKAGGSIFQVKLNNKVLAIKHADDLDKAVQEVIDYVSANEKTYLKQQEKRLAQQKVTLPKLKPVNVTVSEQIDTFQTSISETQGSIESLTGQLTEIKGKNAEKKTSVDTLSTQLSDLVAEGDALQKEYDQLKEVAA